MFDNVIDTPLIAGVPHGLATGVTLTIPTQRYVLLARDPALRKPAIDLLAGLRPPASGSIFRKGACSWPIGRPGFLRGRLTGRQIIVLIARLYRLDNRLCDWIVEEMMTHPRLLGEFIERWPVVARQEFGHILPLLPRFDIYVVDGTFPYRKDRFTLLWRALFEQRLAGRMLILSTVRPSEVNEFCDQALILNSGQIELEKQIDHVLHEFPLRPSPDEFGRGRFDEPFLSDDFT